MSVDLSRGPMLEIGGHRFPQCIVICPPAPDDHDSDFDRSLGTGTDPTRFIPAENGLLIDVAPTQPTGRVPHPSGLTIYLYARACEIRAMPTEKPIYLPVTVTLVSGTLVAWPIGNPWPGGAHSPLSVPGVWHWDEAEPDWAAEHIHRLAHLSFVQPEGPEVKLVRADYFEEDDL